MTELDRDKEEQIRREEKKRKNKEALAEAGIHAAIISVYLLLIGFFNSIFSERTNFLSDYPLRYSVLISTIIVVILSYLILKKYRPDLIEKYKAKIKTSFVQLTLIIGGFLAGYMYSEYYHKYTESDSTENKKPKDTIIETEPNNKVRVKPQKVPGKKTPKETEDQYKSEVLKKIYK